MFDVALFNIPQKILSLFSCVSNFTLLGFIVGTMTQNFSNHNLILNTCNCNMKSGCIISHEKCRCVKSYIRGNSEEVFVQALSHYGWQIPWECKVQAWLHFYQSTPRWKWDVRVHYIEAVEIQGGGITSGHHLQHGSKGSVVRIKYREIIPQPHGLTYDLFQPKMCTSLSFSSTQQKQFLFFSN